MSKKLVAKISLPKKHNSKRRGRRPKRSGKQSGQNTAKGRGVLNGQSSTTHGILTVESIRGMPLFAARTRRMLRYAENVSLTTTSGVMNAYVFSANGLFDPNITGTGHQPAGFDQMMLSYEHYVVTRARLFATFRNTSGNVTCNIGIAQRAGTTILTNAQQTIEDGLITTDTLQGFNGYGVMHSLESNMNVARFQGVDKIVDNPYLRGDAGNNPVEQSYFHLLAWSPDALTNVLSIDVMIEYEAWFLEPRTITQSLAKQFHKLLASEAKSSPSTRR